MAGTTIAEVTVRHLERDARLLELTEDEYRLLDRDRGHYRDVRFYPDAATGERVRVEVYNVIRLRRVEGGS
jgi:hypothetical protein